MLFKDRLDAGRKLARLLGKEPKGRAFVVSLLRGGVVPGSAISKRLKIPHLPLAVAKIPAPGQPELAIGAVCFDFTYLDPRVIASERLTRSVIAAQVARTVEKFRSYTERFRVSKITFHNLKGSTVYLTDDGIATGSTAKAALLFLKSHKPEKVILAVPVAPVGFIIPGFDETVVLHYDPAFSSVSQFYGDFPQVTDNEVLRLLRRSRGKRANTS